jgi:S-adenosylmethionine synthetase
VERGDGSLGAGDQGMMFGYACRETDELMPLPIMLAHKLIRRHSTLRSSGHFHWLKPDAKCQVTVGYQDRQPVHVTHVVFSSQHAADAGLELVNDTLREAIVEDVIPPFLRSPDLQVLINPTGRFVVGGPQGDTGLTGRKIIVDTYGGYCPHGGGAFSGKDPSKVDRSAAYAARWVAKSIVAAGLAERCTVQLAYAIGVAEPVSIMVDSHGTCTVPEYDIERLVQQTFDLTPAGIIKSLDLQRPIYQKTATFGHFGRQKAEFTWENPLSMLHKRTAPYALDCGDVYQEKTSPW